VLLHFSPSIEGYHVRQRRECVREEEKKEGPPRLLDHLLNSTLTHRGGGWKKNRRLRLPALITLLRAPNPVRGSIGKKKTRRAAASLSSAAIIQLSVRSGLRNLSGKEEGKKIWTGMTTLRDFLSLPRKSHGRKRSSCFLTIAHDAPRKSKKRKGGWESVSASTFPPLFKQCQDDWGTGDFRKKKKKEKKKRSAASPPPVWFFSMCRRARA